MKPILLVGEARGEVEARMNSSFVGPSYEAAGWVFAADLGPTHGQWSVLMEWTGIGEPS